VTDQLYFETERARRYTGQPGHLRAPFAKRKATDESRRQAEIDIARRRRVLQTRAAIDEFERAVLNLDLQIAAELECARVRDPSHVAYPIAVRTMVVRRDNMKATIAALSEQLTRID
jgi:uncharacterized metal-binding protein YceD (DUF177 family)